MKDFSFKQKCQMLLTPALMVVLGIILLVRPDSASALVGMVLGWVLIAAGVSCTAFLIKIRDFVVFRALPAIACFVVGVWLLKNPLALASVLGRIAGVIIALQGIQDILHAIEWKCGMTWAVVATAVGVLLILVPMTASRLVMGLCGVALILLGAAEGYGRVKLESPISADTVPEVGAIDMQEEQ